MDKELLSRLDAIAAKLGIAGQELWRVLLKQVQVEIFQNAIWLAVWIVVSVVFAILCKKSWSRNDDDGDFGPGPFLITGLLAILASLALIFTASEIITDILNPEFRALELLRSALKAQ